MTVFDALAGLLHQAGKYTALNQRADKLYEEMKSRGEDVSELGRLSPAYDDGSARLLKDYLQRMGRYFVSDAPVASIPASALGLSEERREELFANLPIPSDIWVVDPAPKKGTLVGARKGPGGVYHFEVECDDGSRYDKYLECDLELSEADALVDSGGDDDVDDPDDSD